MNQNNNKIPRQSDIDNLSDQYDLLIVGGGITGAGIALDAAKRGLKTLLIDKADFASGTSSKSTKLVHGGLRYLKSGEIKLVSSVGKERAVVYRNAPHIVIPQKMLLPLIKNGSFKPWLIRIGLNIYDFIAGVKKTERNTFLSKEETLRIEPNLKDYYLVGGAMYYEYKCSDSRLVIEVCKTAKEYGATVLNYVECKDWIYDNSTISGAVVVDKISGDVHTVKAKCVINATGPWTDKLRERDNSINNKRIHLTKGVHIVFSKEDLPINNALYFDVFDGRMVFIIPRRDTVYVGTTDTDYYEDIDDIKITSEDIEYLCMAVNNQFNMKINRGDVKYSWAGLRCLMAVKGKKASALSRKDEVFLSKSGLISIAGGKLTGYRLMAKKVVDMVSKRLSKRFNARYEECTTKDTRLSGGKFGFEPDTMLMVEHCDYKYDEAKQTGIEPEDFKLLFYRYGSNIDIITEKAYELMSPKRHWTDFWLEAEIWYSIFYEHTLYASDFILFRISIPYFHYNILSNKFAEDVCNIFNKYVGDIYDVKEDLTDIKKKINPSYASGI